MRWTSENTHEKTLEKGAQKCLRWSHRRCPRKHCGADDTRSCGRNGPSGRTAESPANRGGGNGWLGQHQKCGCPDRDSSRILDTDRVSSRTLLTEFTLRDVDETPANPHPFIPKKHDARLDRTRVSCAGQEDFGSTLDRYKRVVLECKATELHVASGSSNYWSCTGSFYSQEPFW